MTVHKKKRLSFSLLVIYLMLAGASTAEEAQEYAVWRVVNYWSEWCSPCRKEIPMLNALSQALDSSKIRVVGVNFDEDPREVTLEIAEKLGIEFQILTRAETVNLSLRAPDVMPTTYILTPDNQLAATLIGLQSREQMLAQLSRLGLLAGNQ
ncbi:MAG: TlpA family protein disulfide reductase [Chromatocurvus sp.]